MINYDYFIVKNIKGNTPKEKFENLIAMKNILSEIAYPRRGEENKKNLFDFANEIQTLFTVQDLEENSDI
jgi:hypothetical protein